MVGRCRALQVTNIGDAPLTGGFKVVWEPTQGRVYDSRVCNNPFPALPPGWASCPACEGTLVNGEESSRCFAVWTADLAVGQETSPVSWPIRPRVLTGGFTSPLAAKVLMSPLLSILPFSVVFAVYSSLRMLTVDIHCVLLMSCRSGLTSRLSYLRSKLWPWQPVW